MQRRLCVLRAVVSSALLLTTVNVRAAEPTYQLSVVTDRPAAIYSVGEKVRFLVTLKKGGQPATEGKVSYTVDKERHAACRTGHAPGGFDGVGHRRHVGRTGRSALHGRLSG